MLPPTLVLICFLLMIGLHVLWPFAVIFPIPINLLGLIPLAAGLFLNISTSQMFTRVGTNIKTFNEPDKLVTEG